MGGGDQTEEVIKQEGGARTGGGVISLTNKNVSISYLIVITKFVSNPPPLFQKKS